MTGKLVRTPDATHPITISRTGSRVTVTLGGIVIADTRDALTLQESTYPAVQYLPRADVRMDLLEPSDHATYCPYKGDCSYFSIPTLGERGANAVWSYTDPYAPVAEIREHLAFYPDRVHIDVEPAAG